MQIAEKTYADYELVDRMAGETNAVLKWLNQAWIPAKAYAELDRQASTGERRAHAAGSSRACERNIQKPMRKSTSRIPNSRKVGWSSSPMAK